MDAFPAFFPLAGRKVVVVGDGEAADNKARLFDGSPAELVRLTDAQAADASFAGAALVFIASADKALIRKTSDAARAAGAAVNVVDHPLLCDFYTPAIVDRGAVVAAVGATGAAPLLAALLRNEIESLLPDGAGRLAELFRVTREEVRKALPDMTARRAFLRRALASPAAEAALGGDMAAALRLMREDLGSLAGGPVSATTSAMGRIDFIVGDGPVDLLSLRAARALSQADVLIVDPASAPKIASEIAARARRDAQRPPFAEGATLRLVELAGEGARVVCVITGPLDPSIPRALILAGARVAVHERAPT
jgi:precorrin-2 dehydrogenase/sirohydrochlorin ferrochelatase